MILLRDLFGPRPKFTTIPLKASDGESYTLTVLDQSRDSAGRVMWNGRRAGAVIASDSRNISGTGLAPLPATPWRKGIEPGKGKKYPPAPFVLDQGNVGACVAFGFCGRHNAGPKLHQLDNAAALALYNEGCEMEGHAGVDSGLYSLTGAKLMRRHGYVSRFYDLGYRIVGENAAFSINLIAEWLRSGRGPVALGTIWRREMFVPDNRGYVKFAGPIEGGHLLYIRDIVFTAKRNGYLVLVNSWGPAWGIGGECRMVFDEFRRLQSWAPDVYGVEEAA